MNGGWCSGWSTPTGRGPIVNGGRGPVVNTALIPKNLDTTRITMTQRSNVIFNSTVIFFDIFLLMYLKIQGLYLTKLH